MVLGVIEYSMIKQVKYKKCKECLANYPDHPDYVHECDGLMKYLVQYAKRKKKNENKV